MLADLAAADGAAHTFGQQAYEILSSLTPKLLRFDPDYAVHQIETLRRLLLEGQGEHSAALDRMRRRIRNDLEPMLQRQEKLAEQASLPERVAELERRLSELERQGKITPFRKAE